MNERIKELAEQVGMRSPDLFKLTVAHMAVGSLEKFNELTILDCIRTLRSNGYDDAAQCLHDIHFGIDDPV